MTVQFPENPTEKMWYGLDFTVSFNDGHDYRIVGHCATGVWISSPSML